MTLFSKKSHWSCSSPFNHINRVSLCHCVFSNFMLSKLRCPVSDVGRPARPISAQLFQSANSGGRENAAGPCCTPATNSLLSTDVNNCQLMSMYVNVNIWCQLMSTELSTYISSAGPPRQTLIQLHMRCICWWASTSRSDTLREADMQALGEQV